MPLSAADRDLLTALPDAELLALTAFLEARSEPVQGILGVMFVVLNRVAKHQRGATIAEVILAPLQFSSWNPRDPNCALGLSLAQEPDPNHPDAIVLDVCRYLAQSVLVKGPRLHDPTHFATHYYNPDSVTHRPAWADPTTGAEMTARIGRHTFWRNVK